MSVIGFSISTSSAAAAITCPFDWKLSLDVCSLAHLLCSSFGSVGGHLGHRLDLVQAPIRTMLPNGVLKFLVLLSHWLTDLVTEEPSFGKSLLLSGIPHVTPNDIEDSYSTV